MLMGPGGEGKGMYHYLYERFLYLDIVESIVSLPEARSLRAGPGLERRTEWKTDRFEERFGVAGVQSRGQSRREQGILQKTAQCSARANRKQEAARGKGDKQRTEHIARV